MKRRFQHLFALCLAMALFAVSLSVPALASVPDRPQNQYVLDSAGVLSDATEREIVSQNQKLFQETGAEIVIAAVDFLGGDEIDDYVYEMFNTWGVGSKERNNGILLVLAIGEDNYYAQAGYGIEDTFTGSRLDDLLYEYLEPDFAAGSYDAGVKKFFNAVLEEMNSYYRDYEDEYTQEKSFNQGGTNTDWDSTGSYEDSGFFGSAVPMIIGFVVRIVVVLVIVVVVIAIIRAITRGGGGGPYNGGGGGGGFWTGMFLGNMLGGRRRRVGYRPPPPGPGGFWGPGPGPRPPRGGSGFGGFGGFSGGGRSHGGGMGRGGGFSRGGGSRGGGAGRR